MSDCAASQSVMSKTFNYLELCARSHEFLRRGCSFTPMDVSWAGDLIIINETILKQSEVNDMRGGDCVVEHKYPAQSEECSETTVGLPNQYVVESTDIRTGGANTFEYTVPKATNEEDETQWDLNIYQSLNDCGVLMDGGDALQHPSVMGRVVSLCGTIDKQGMNPQAHYLDNRKSYSKDPDNGLLVAIRTGFKWNWEIRYAPVERNLTAGLMMSDDVTAAFRAALAEEGMTDDDVFEFGMI
ncbi:hypothetical protein LLG39_08910 [bacterium]|nr:hypothetical protein [bacterium]